MSLPTMSCARDLSRNDLGRQRGGSPTLRVRGPRPPQLPSLLQREDQPPLADVLHPRADEGDALTDEEETEVAVGEGPEPVASGSPPAGGQGHCVKGRERMTLWVET